MWKEQIRHRQQAAAHWICPFPPNPPSLPGRGCGERRRKKKKVEEASLGKHKLLNATFWCSDVFHRSALLSIVTYYILGQLIIPPDLYDFQPCPVKDHPCNSFQPNFPESLWILLSPFWVTKPLHLTQVAYFACLVLQGKMSFLGIKGIIYVLFRKINPFLFLQMVLKCEVNSKTQVHEDHEVCFC